VPNSVSLTLAVRWMAGPAPSGLRALSGSRLN
jgi:hypothetical protein